MADDEGNNLLNPGDTLTTTFIPGVCSAVLRAVDKFQGCCAMSIARGE